MDSEISLKKVDTEDVVDDTKMKTEDVLQIVKEVMREEDETDGEFIKVEKESLDVKDGPVMSGMAFPEDDMPSTMKRSISGSNREVLEALEKIKEVELELERVTAALKQSESENMKLKDEALELKEKLQEAEKKHDELKFDQMKLQEQMTESEERQGLHLNAMQEALQAQEAKHKELVEVKDAFGALSLELENSRKRMQELENELQLSRRETKKLEELHKHSCSHAESEMARALELERLLDEAKTSAKEMEGQLASLQEELNGLYEKIAENHIVGEALQSTAKELSTVKEELELTKSQLVDMKQEFSAKDALVSQLTEELDQKKASESQLREDILALENLLVATKEDLQVKVSEFEDIKLKLQEISSARDKFESGLKTQEAQVLIAEEELANVKKEKEALEVMVADLVKDAVQLKELCGNLDEKLKISDENFHKVDALLSQALSNNAELDLKLKSVEELHNESGAAAATATQKNLELEDLIRASKEAAEEATSQLREWKSCCIGAEQRNVELEQKLNLVELKSSDTERELREIMEKLSEFDTAFEKTEKEKKLLNDQLQEQQAKITHLESVLRQSSERSLELEEELKVSSAKCAEHENRARMNHQRSLELEGLFQASHSMAEDAGKKVNELELLLETGKYRIQELEEQIGALERKCMDAEVDSKKYSDKVSELASELEAFQTRASSLEVLLQLANEKEKELTESLNYISDEKRRLEEESSTSCKLLFEVENLVVVLRNELNIVQERLEMIENDLKNAGLREIDVLAKLKSAEEQLEKQEFLIDQATASKSELEALHESLKRDSELKLQEVVTNLSNRESESKFLIEKIKNLEDQVKLYEEQVAEAAGRYAMVKEELDLYLVQVPSLEESNEVLKKQISEAETKASHSLSEIKILVETNSQLKLKMNELQDLLSDTTTEKEAMVQQLASHSSTITEITDKLKELVEVKDAFSGLSLELENSRKRMQELENELQLSNSEVKKLEELHKHSCSHAESEMARALDLERLLDEAKASAKEMEGQLASLQEELNGLYEKIAENHKVGEALQSTAKELSTVKEELDLTKSQLVDMKQEFSTKDARVSQLTEELDLKKASESQLREDILALENLLAATQEDLQGKVSEFEDIKLKLQEISSTRDKFECGLKTQEAQVLIAEEELANVKKEKEALEVMVADLVKDAVQLKELCGNLEEKLKISDENFHKVDALLSQALSSNAELDLKLKSVEELHNEYGAAAATATQKNLELEDLIRASKEAAEEATSQLREWKSRCIGAEQRNVELEQNLNLAELKSSDTERELREITEKLSEFGTAFEKTEKEKKLLNDQLQEQQAKITHLASVLRQSSERSLELEEELKVSSAKCAEHENQARMSHQRSLELEGLFQASHSMAENAGKKVNELELLLETGKYRIQELEEQIGALERKCMDAEFDSKKFSDKVSELTSELEAFQTRASSLEDALQLANEKEKELTESLNCMSDEKRRLEEESSTSSKQLFEAENLVQVLRNELNVVQERLEMIENDLKTTGLRETCVLAKLKSAEEQLEKQEFLIEQATASKLELEALHKSLKRDSDLKLQEVVTNLSNRECESKSLIEKITNLEDQVKLNEEQVAEAAGRYTLVKEELDLYLVKVASLEESNEELKKQISEAETKASDSLSENKILVETNSQLNLKINELQDLLSATTTEKEATAQRLASHLSTISEITEKHSRAVELHCAIEAEMVKRESELREAIQKLNEIDLEKKDLTEKLNSLQEQIRSYEWQLGQESAIAESRRVELEETLLKLKDLVSVVEELKTKSDHFERDGAELAEANLRLTQDLALYENKLSDLEAKLSVTVLEKLDAIEQLYTSKKAVADLTQQLSDERQKLQSQISSVVEENNLLNETYQNAMKELQSVIIQLEEQKNNEDALKTEVENLKVDNAEKLALQNRHKELEEQLASSEDRLKQELQEKQAKITHLELVLKQSSERSLELEEELKVSSAKCAEHEDRAKMSHQRSLELEDLFQVSHSNAEDAGKMVNELELLLESGKYRIQELEEQIGALERKCMDAEFDSKKFSDKVSELTSELEAFQTRASSLEAALQLANEKEKELTESLNCMSDEKRRLEEESSTSSKQLFEAENLVQVLRNELYVVQERLEMIENDLKTTGLRETCVLAKLKSAKEQLEKQEFLIEQATASKLELEALHKSLKRDSDLKLQEVVTNLSNRECESKSLIEKITNLEDQVKLNEEQVAEAAGRYTLVKEELDLYLVKVASLEESNEELKKQISEAETKASDSLSENKILVETNSQLNLKINELQDSLIATTTEKEATAQQIASHLSTISEITEKHSRAVELHCAIEAEMVKRESELREAIQKLNEIDVEKKDLTEKLNSLEEQIRSYERQLGQESAIAESRRVELEETLLKLKDLVSVVEELKTKSDHFERDGAELAKANLRLTQDLALYENKLGDLEAKLSVTVLEKLDAIEQLYTSKKAVADLTQQLSDERQKLRSQISSVVEENNLLNETYQSALKELQSVIIQLEEQKNNEDALKTEVENLKVDYAEKLALQNRHKELEEQLASSEDRLKQELQEQQAKITHLELVLKQSSERSLELEEELKVSLAKCAEHEDRAKMSHQRSLELEGLFQASHSMAEDAGKMVNELELLLETGKYRIQELEVQIGALERKCMDAEFDSKKFSDRVSELTSELEAFQTRASSLEAALQLANEKEKELTESLNCMSDEKRRLEEESSTSSKQLFEAENLVQVLRNELNVVQERLEMIENDLKTTGLRETCVLAKLKSAEEQLEKQEFLIEQATASKLELEALHKSLKRDSDLKLQEVVTNLSNRECESKSLIEKITNLEDQVKLNEEQVAEAAGRYTLVKEELDLYLVKVASLEESNEELKKQISEAETKASDSLSENKILVETNSQLNLKINELQDLLSATTTEKEATAQQLASHLSTISEITEKHSRAVELHCAIEAEMVKRESELQEAIQKLNEIDVEKKDLTEKLNSLEEQIRSYEQQMAQESAIAESRRAELEETLLKSKDLESVILELKTRSDHFEKDGAGLAETNLRLNQELDLYENKLSDLEAKLSVSVSEKLDAIEQLNTSKKAIDVLTQQLSDEGQKLQSQISSVVEENNLLNETYQNAIKELQSVIIQLEEQLKEQKNNLDALKTEVENLKADNAKKLALQNHLKELEEQLASSEDRLKQVNKLYSEKEIEKEAAQRKALEDLESKNTEILALEGQLKELQQKLQVADAKLLEKGVDAISMEHSKDGVDIKSRDIGSAISTPTKRKSKKKLEASPVQAPSSSESLAQSTEVSTLMTLKFILGVVLVSIIIGIFLGKRY